MRFIFQLIVGEQCTKCRALWSVSQRFSTKWNVSSYSINLQYIWFYVTVACTSIISKEEHVQCTYVQEYILGMCHLTILPCKAERQYKLILQVNISCLFGFAEQNKSHGNVISQSEYPDVHWFHFGQIFQKYLLICDRFFQINVMC